MDNEISNSSELAQWVRSVALANGATRAVAHGFEGAVVIVLGGHPAVSMLRISKRRGRGNSYLSVDYSKGPPRPVDVSVDGHVTLPSCTRWERLWDGSDETKMVRAISKLLSRERRRRPSVTTLVDLSRALKRLNSVVTIFELGDTFTVVLRNDRAQVIAKATHEHLDTATSLAISQADKRAK